jgi:hypothetical protein
MDGKERAAALASVAQGKEHRAVNRKVWRDVTIGNQLKRYMRIADEKAKAKCPDSDGAQTSAASEAHESESNDRQWQEASP